MHHRAYVILVFLGVVCASEAFHSFFPSEKEIIYKYNGVISASTDIPRLYTSSFILNGNLHIQKDNEAILAKFSDLTYQLYNGIEEDFESTTLPLPEELNDFYKVFRIDYEPSGNIAGIATGETEQKYVVNFKKAISSLLQLDLELIEKYDIADSYAFHTYENSIYGKGKVYYNVKPRNMSYYIDIVQEPSTTQHMYTHLLTNMEYDSPMSDYDEPISRDNQRHCVLSKHNDDKIIDSIEQTGGIYYQPFNGKSDAHVIYVNQSITFVNQEPITAKMQIEKEYFNNDLTYHTADLQHVDGALPDFTNGRRMWNKELLIKTSVDMIKELVKYIYNHQLISNRPDMKKGQLITRLTRIMLTFDQKSLEELREKLAATDVDLEYLHGVYDNVYLQMLPLLGTHAAYYHLKHLILENKLNSHDYVQDMFANVKYPNKKLVDDMSDMLEWKHETDRFNDEAVLSFATLLHKAVERNHLYTHKYAKYGSKKQHKYDFNPTNNLEEDFPDHTYYEKYVIKIVSKLKASTDYNKQILYLYALYNTKMDSIVQHLLPAIRGEWWKDNHLRMMAALAVSPIVTKNEDLTSKIYWPFMTDSNTPTSFRILAYFMIMKSRPSLPKLINIYWVMQSTQNHDLYQFHYKYINEMSKSENPHIRKFIVHINQLLRYTYKPEMRGLTGYYQLDYFDNEYSFGEQATLLTIHSKLENEIVIKGSYEYNTNRLQTTPYWIFLRISGFDHSLLKDLKLDTNSTSNLFTYENLWNAVMNLGNNEDTKVTLIIASNHHVREIFTFDKSNINDITNVIKMFAGKFSFNDAGIDIKYELSKTIILPTEMGFPAVFQSYVPNLDYSDIEINRVDKDQVTTFNFDLIYKNWMHSRRGLSFYNPVLDVWQGVNKYNAYDSNLYIKFEITIDRHQQTYKLSWNVSSDPDNGGVIFTERTYATTMVFVKDDFDTKILQKSSPKCNNFEIVTLGKEYQKHYITMSHPVLGMNAVLTESIFDSENNNIASHNFKDVDDYRTMLKLFARTERFYELNPEPGNYAIMRSFQINVFYPISTVDLVLQYNTEYTKGSHYLLPAAQHNIKISCITRYGENVQSSWKLTAKANMNAGHTNNNYQVIASKFVKGKEIKGCIDGENINTGDGFTSTHVFSCNFIPGKTCSKDDPLLTVLFNGQTSEEQKTDSHSYDSCLERIVGPMDNQKSLQCFSDTTSLRTLTFNVSINVPGFDPKDLSAVDSVFDELSKYAEDSYKLEPNNDTKPNEIQAVVDFPMTKNVMNLKVFRTNNVLSYKDVPIESDYLAFPKTQYNKIFALMHRLALTHVCLIRDNKLTNINEEVIKYDLPVVWTLFLGDDETGSKFSVWLKSAGSNKLDLKVIYKSHSLIVESKDNANASITIDGKTLEESKYTNDWIHYGWVKDAHVLSIFAEHFGCHIIYNGHQVQIEYPQMENIDMHGKCLHLSL